jgi:hypothetical protein
MNQNNPNALQILRSMTENPVIMLSTPNFTHLDCQEIVKRQMSYLIRKGWIDCNFAPSYRVDTILPMRHEQVLINQIQSLLDRGYFDR